MKRQARRLTSPVRKQRGVTIVEYAIAGGLLAASVIASFSELGDGIGAVIDLLVAALASVLS